MPAPTVDCISSGLAGLDDDFPDSPTLPQIINRLGRLLQRIHLRHQRLQLAQRQPQDNAANFQQLFTWHGEGKLKPLVSQVYALEQAAQAINDLGQRRAVGKVVVQSTSSLAP